MSPTRHATSRFRRRGVVVVTSDEWSAACWFASLPPGAISPVNAPGSGHAR
jgi:hypothetical protein